jgi:Icc-related predicted phosphoesterase
MNINTTSFITDIEQQKWKNSFFFIQMADTQFGMFYDVDQGTNKCEPEVELTDKAIAKINLLRPLFCVMCGDLTQVGPDGGGRYNKVGTKELYDEQVNIYKSQMEKIDQSIPLICVCGNHDIENVPNVYTLNKYVENFGKDYFSFWAGGCRFLVLNSTLLLKPENAPEQYKLQNEWLDKELELLGSDSNTATHTILFMHHPPALNDINEKDEYYNPQSPINFPKEIRLPFLERFSKAGICAIFAGHYHRNAYVKYKDLEIVTTSAVGFQLGKDKSGFAIVKIFQDKIEHQYYPLDEILSSINL